MISCDICKKVQDAIRNEDAGTIVTKTRLIQIHGFLPEDAMQGLRLFSNCDKYPRDCPK